MKIALALVLLTTFAIQSHAIEVTKQSWLTSMETALPTVFCGSSMYFRQCFSVSAQQCEEAAVSATRICLKRNAANIPNILIQPQDGTHWGTVIGTCAGQSYEIALMKQKVSNTKCNDITNWQ